ncbi:copper resistance protein CopB [Altererythrobacter sp. B11]|uniref:copper resistance protein B n=1 Tax=Altererythrobacter sp. B11 TaxID=2060312 RepID=UPI000DC6FE4D|nr:copper resistance protein B [Altererythrobacter sp. B11]BBC73875.1 copper resistance protein CopB [Altererythrobacter sp. B11]
MMRALLPLLLAGAAFPAAAQDHSTHHTDPPPAKADQDHEEMDHGTMDHSQMDHGEVDHGAMDHPQADQDAMDYSQMDHGAMDHSQMDHGQMDHSQMGHAMPEEGGAAPPASGPPPRAFTGPEHAADGTFGTAAMEPARAEMARENGGFATTTLMLERMEAQLGKGRDLYLWDAQGWTGGDTDKLWLKSEGEGAFSGAVEDAELQALWSHAIGPWFDLQTGVRYDLEPDSRAYAVLGVQGLAPYLFELDAAAFLSDRGDLTARVEAEYDQRITQRLILQPRVEATLAAQDVPEAGLGAGLSSVEAGLRLRYEIRREFAPYVGVEYAGKFGGTADFARAAGEDPHRARLLLGLRAWF